MARVLGVPPPPDVGTADVGADVALTVSTGGHRARPPESRSPESERPG